MVTNRYQSIFFFILLVGALALMYFVMRPYIVPAFIAVVCAVVFRSFHENVEGRFKNRNVAAFVSVLAVVVLIVVPLVIIGMLIYSEASDFYVSLSQKDTPGGYLNYGLEKIDQHLQSFAPQIKIDLRSYITAGLSWLVSHTGSIFSAFLNIIVELMIMMFALFYLFRDGSKLRQIVVKLSPLDESDDVNILNKLEVTINSVVRGSLIIAIIQGSLTAIGFTIFGISQPVLWGIVAAFASLIPGIGTALVTIPAVIFLFVTGNVWSGVGYALWGAVATGGIDNILSPHLINGKVKIHPFLILISVLGGLVFFGPIGFLAGPIALAFATELLKLYPKFVIRSSPSA